MPLPKSEKTTMFRSFDPAEHARAALSSLVKIADPAFGYLPYGKLNAFTTTPFLEHTRRDDSEFAAAWYEAISCAREMTRSKEGAKEEAALRKLVLEEGWEESTGLRYPTRRPWSGPVDYCVLSEMATVLSALNRMIAVNKDDALAKQRAHDLIAGLRKIATAHTERLTPFGSYPSEKPVYSFISDVVVRGKGFAPELSTGFADSILRTCTLIHPAMVHYSLTKEKASLDLAKGLANYITGLSHFFSHKTEFQGEVHSALMAAAGLARLGRVLSQDRYVARAKSLYDYVRRNASSFGWVPEYLQWQLTAEEMCDATCTADMIICAIELVNCSFPEYWDDVHRFWRNHLAQSQILETSWIPHPQHLPEDTPSRTYKNIRERLSGAFCGASTPCFIAFSKPGLFSARATAFSTRGMYWAWSHAIEINRDLITLNFPISIDMPYAKVTVDYPNEGVVKIEFRKDCRINIRSYPWMAAPHEGYVNKRPAAIDHHDNHISFPACKAGSVAVLHHEIKTVRNVENITTLQFWGIWRGPDMVDVLPHGAGVGLRIYQRNLSAPKDHVSKLAPPSTPIDIPLEPSVSKETRLNRRKAPRG